MHFIIRAYKYAHLPTHAVGMTCVAVETRAALVALCKGSCELGGRPSAIGPDLQVRVPVGGWGGSSCPLVVLTVPPGCPVQPAVTQPKLQ